MNADGDVSQGSESISALIRRIEGGDSSALMALYDETSPLVFGLIVRILGESTSAEETLLDVYTHIWKQPACCDAGLSALGSLMTVARDSALARLDWRNRSKGNRETSANPAEPAFTVAPEQQKLARFCLDSMASTEREVLEWAYYSGLSCADIAAQIGNPLGAVKRHIRMGLTKISGSFSPASGEMQSRTATGGHIEARKSD